MKANAGQIRSALAAPSTDIRLYLLHGPDEAGANDLARQLGAALGPDADRIDLDGATLKGDPARLTDEAAALSLFGGTRYIRVTGVGEESLAAFAALLEAERAGNPVVAIASGVKTTGKIVKLALDSRQAMAFACYQPSPADIERLALAIGSDLGLRIDPELARRLATASGGDRAVLTQEIHKLALYYDAAPDRPQVLNAAGLDALGADVEDSETARLVDAVVTGRSDALGSELERLGAANVSPVPWLRQLARQLIALAEMRTEIDRGEPAPSVMKKHRVHFSREASTARDLRRWNPAMLTEALARVRAAERTIMAPGNAGEVLARAVVTTLTRRVGGR